VKQVALSGEDAADAVCLELGVGGGHGFRGNGAAYKRIADWTAEVRVWRPARQPEKRPALT
jgi:hypothetical protein